MFSGDSMAANDGDQFTTTDRDNDVWTSGNCAEDHGRGGWRCVPPHTQCPRCHWDLVVLLAWSSIFPKSNNYDDTEDMRRQRCFIIRDSLPLHIFYQ